MKTKKILNKVALAFALLTVIAFVIAVSPAVLSIILAIIALLIAIFGVVVFVFGGLIALFTLASGTNVWNGVLSLSMGSWGAAGFIFSIVPPMAEFCFSGMSQICAGIGIGFGVVALIVSSIALSLKQSQDEGESELEEPVEVGQTEETVKKPKKKKTDRALSITSLVLSIVFGVLNVITILASNAIAARFF